ncbi:MAG: hypothetical protein N2645_08530 [Clostridia bacterium]|nr:hypothetical protein [Clostridia bacterium]
MENNLIKQINELFEAENLHMDLLTEKFNCLLSKMNYTDQLGLHDALTATGGSYVNSIRV